MKPDFDWSVRVRSIAPSEARAYARNNTFTIGQQASMKESDPHPSATEMLLGALAADLIEGLRVAASRKSVTIDAMEATATGRLDNVLVHLDVIGEEGHPGFKTIDLTLYATTDADDAIMDALWKET